jgi:hypothetical protein
VDTAPAQVVRDIQQVLAEPLDGELLRRLGLPPRPLAQVLHVRQRAQELVVQILHLRVPLAELGAELLRLLVALDGVITLICLFLGVVLLLPFRAERAGRRRARTRERLEGRHARSRRSDRRRSRGGGGKPASRGGRDGRDAVVRLAGRCRVAGEPDPSARAEHRTERGHRTRRAEV